MAETIYRKGETTHENLLSFLHDDIYASYVLEIVHLLLLFLLLLLLLLLLFFIEATARTTQRLDLGFAPF